jgi:hypothetical protein
MVLLLIAIMTIALTAAFTLNTNETRVGDDQSEQLAALALAESGRHRFLTERAALGHTVTPPAVAETVVVNYAGGHAQVILTRIRPQVNQLPPLYVLRSRGVRTAGKAGAPLAERTVSQLVYWDAQPLNVLAGWTAMTGARKNGVNANSVSGVDANPGTGGCPPTLGTVAAVAVPNVPGFIGDVGNLTGTPQVQSLGDATATNDAVDIDWAAIVNMTADIAYDIIIPGGVWPTAIQFADPNYWPTIRINGDYVLGTYGKGTLIITGNLTMNSVSARWDGVVLVGGVLTSNGNTGVSGATVTGLNVKLGMVVAESDIGNGTKSYRYNSCSTANALKQQAKLRPYPNTWMDNWASW